LEKLGKNNELPFFADASIVGDYKPLYKYWELLRRRGRSVEKAMLNNEDFRFLEEVVNATPGLDVESLLNMLTNRFLERIDCKLAIEAYREAYNIVLSEDDACKKLARILAGWLIEAGKNTGILRLKYSWRS
jgi:hypothetical protein